MEKLTQARMASSFRERHRAPPLLLLPNAWDPLSARLFVDAGFEMLATTSGGVAWALGYPDGEIAPWPEVVAATQRIVRAAQVPVTADIEAGYGDSAAEVEAHVADIIRAGVVGINLEDGLHGSIRSVADATSRLHAARQAARKEGVPIFLNARCDIYQVQHGKPEERFDAIVERAKAYVAAGADGFYPFGLRDLATIAKLAKALTVPVNITGRPGMPGVEELERIGVARVTIASAPTLVAMTTIRNLAHDLHDKGSFDCLQAEFTRPDAQKLFSAKDDRNAGQT
jgi:2-methylisocitrate lyase-like PEP mutase family enzyme